MLENCMDEQTQNKTMFGSFDKENKREEKKQRNISVSKFGEVSERYLNLWKWAVRALKFVSSMRVVWI